MHILSSFFLTNVTVYTGKIKPITKEGRFRSVSELLGNFVEATKTIFIAIRYYQIFINHQTP